jgi:hypothetical protein
VSMEDKLKRAAAFAATEATQRERARCLWILDQIAEQTADGVRKKLLIESERHVMQIKHALAKALISMARRGIISGAAPKIVKTDAQRIVEEMGDET